MKNLVAVVIVFACAAQIVAVSTPAAAADYLAIYHIDVGQGDATLVRGPGTNGKTLLIDAGNRGKGRKKVGALLQRLGIERIDYVIASHYDADHIGGFDEISALTQNVSATAYDHGEEGALPKKTTVQYKEYVTMFEANRKTVKLGPTPFTLGTGVKTTFVAANGCVLTKRNKQEGARLDYNGASVSLVLSYGTFDYFIGGDLTGGGRSGSRRTQDVETLVAPVVGDLDVLRISHHGSQTSSNAEFLQTVTPEVAIISVGNGGSNKSRYHHPRREVLNRLHALNQNQSLKRVFMTNRGETDGGLRPRDHETLLTVAKGDIAIFADGKHYTVNGVTYATDGKLSAAAAASQTTEECNTNGN